MMIDSDTGDAKCILSEPVADRKNLHDMWEIGQSHDRVKPINTQPDRITLQGIAKLPFVIEPPSDAIKESLLWRALSSGLSSHWFNDLALGTRDSLARAVLAFLHWLYADGGKCLVDQRVLAHYSHWEIEVCKAKSNSKSKLVATVLREARDGLNQFELADLVRIDKNFKIIRGDGVAESLCDWFLSIEWLRGDMEAKGLESHYLKLESPRMLYESISVCYQSMLTELQLIRENCLRIRTPTPQEIEKDMLVVPSKGAEIKKYKHLQLEQLAWFTPILRAVSEESTAREFLFSCWFGIRADLAIKRFEKDPSAIGRILNAGDKQHACQSPYSFNRANLFIPSRIEQFLLMHLVALLAVQPSQAGRLRLDNLVILRNSLGRPLSFQIRYRKGRAKSALKETEALSVKSRLGRVMFTYYNLIQGAQEYLPEPLRGYLTPAFISINSSVKIGCAQQGNSINLSNLMYYWLRCPKICSKLFNNYRQQRVSSVFYQAFITFIEADAKTRSQVREKKKKLGNKAVIQKVFPEQLWGNQSLKQLKVYASSDAYRVGDLVNYNSHTSETERMHYLNDNNKEWVNRHGRITRLVINDLKNHVYSHDTSNVETVIKGLAYERMLRTEIVMVLDAGFNEEEVLLNRIRPNSLDIESITGQHDFNNIVVVDHPATVLYLEHYLSQAAQYSKQLALCAPEFLEKTVAPRCEWMELIRDKLSIENVQSGRKLYAAVQSTLPNLFTTQIRTESFDVDQI
jgi:hypothetical protein